MFGGGGGMDPRKMQQMMEQMGVDFGELDADEIVIRLEDGEELSFDDADGGDAGSDVAQQDVDIVVERTGASEDAAREALENTGGDLAAAIDMLE